MMRARGGPWRAAPQVAGWTLLLTVSLILIGCFGGSSSEPTYTVTIEVLGEGTTTPAEGMESYPRGTLLELEAAPGHDWEFGLWSGPVDDPTARVTAVVVDQSMTITACFVSESASVDILDPGERITGVDDVGLGAMDTAIDDPTPIFIERIPDPAPEVPLPHHLRLIDAVGEFYEITALTTLSTPEETFVILALPVPPGADTDRLGILVLAPPDLVASDPPEDTPSQRWYTLSGTYDPQENLFLTGLRYVGREPEVFALVEGLNYPAFDIQALSASEFSVTCVGFADGDCTQANIDATEATLNDALTTFLNLGLPEPLLRRQRQWTLWPPGYWRTGPYEYELRLTDPAHPTRRGVYTRWPNSGIAATFFDAGDSPINSVARHELFHAVQHSQLCWDWGVPNRNYGYMEGTAVLAQGLLRPPSRYAHRSPLEISASLFSRTRANTDGAWQIDYRTVDFWAYLGRQLDPNSGDSFLVDIVLQGGHRDAIDTWLSGTAAFDGLSDAYWQWAKDYAFEKQTSLGHWNSTAIPMGSPGHWWTRALGSPSSHRAEFLYGDWAFTPVSVTEFSLAPLSSRALEINLYPPTYGYYEIQLDVESNHPGVMFQFYDGGELNQWQENQSPLIQVQEGSKKTVYLLASNTSLDQDSGTIRLTHEPEPEMHRLLVEACDTLRPPILTDEWPPVWTWVEVSPPPPRWPTVCVGGTDVEFEYPAGTQVQVAVPEHFDDYYLFSHWEGPVSALYNHETSLTMNQSATLTPVYEVPVAREKYEAIDRSYIEGLEHLLSSEKINSSQDERNEMPNDSILFFATRHERLGKMQIIDNTDPLQLEFRYTVYTYHGDEYVRSDASTVGGTFVFDLENNTQPLPEDLGDFWWEHTAYHGGGQEGDPIYLTPRNDALFYVYWRPESDIPQFDLDWPPDWWPEPIFDPWLPPLEPDPIEPDPWPIWDPTLDWPDFYY